jgi:hypothetical protein
MAGKPIPTGAQATGRGTAERPSNKLLAGTTFITGDHMVVFLASWSLQRYGTIVLDPCRMSSMRASRERSLQGREAMQA